jgi:sugar lactone lactonase YvrE
LPASTPLPSDTWSYIVSDESRECPVGGPIYRIQGDEITVLAQGLPLKKPRGMLFDGAGDLIVADGWGGLIRVDPQDGSASVIAFGPPFSPRDVAIDQNGNFVVVEQSRALPTGSLGSPAVYRVTPEGEVTVVALGPPLVEPHGLVLDRHGNYIVGDTGAGVIRVTPQGEMTVVAPSGPGTRIGAAVDVTLDAEGNYIVADGPRGALLRVTPSGGVTVIRRGPPFSAGIETGLPGPRGVVIDGNGDYVLVDEGSRTVFRVTPNGQVSTVFQGGSLCGPTDLLLEPRSQ